MAKRMLIDARHPEETRVAVINGNRIEEFDFESADRQQLKGNIYLAKVTRVEPSLQAAFVDYGGNRHGFLAFSEIHPDYYQIPREDREALLREEAEHAAEEEALRSRRADEYAARQNNDDDDEDGDNESNDDDHQDHADDEDDGNGPPSSTGGGHEDSAADALRQKRLALRRRYKIQDVIRRRQVLLVQVVKEERGNKGAALTTYLSLAGRYCVLMPNTTHGGGISRKISNQVDRKRLKQIIAELDLPSSMGCIIRTAGLERTRTEIKRDFDYLTRLWDEIRDNTLQSSAPALIHEDSNLIKRAIRDIYSREISDVLVEGDEGYRAAKTFMRLLMPSHARKVQPYIDPVPLFQRFSVEGQLQQMYHPVVQLRSGGYLVINPTEALVSIDINSGRSTREHNIEETALKTNLEAAEEIARQLRLRDMAGLVVIDFIDMESNSNTRKVERAMKEALKNDRARIQVGRISSFGLMEMSRQRLRTGVLEASTHSCPMCEGTGLVRTIPSAALSALRGIEEEAVRGRGSELTLRCGIEVAIYILNRKRDDIGALEQRYGVHIEILPDDAIQSSQYAIEAAGPPPVRNTDLQTSVPAISDLAAEDEDPEIDDDIDDVEDHETAESDGENDRGDRRRRRRRRRRPARRDGGDHHADGMNGDQDSSEATANDGNDDADTSADDIAGDNADSAEDEAGQATSNADQPSENGNRRRRRRGRRGGRRNREDGQNGNAIAADNENEGDDNTEDTVSDVSDIGTAESTSIAADQTEARETIAAGTESEEAGQANASPRADTGQGEDPSATVEEAPVEAAPAEEAKLRRAPARRRPRAKKAEAETTAAETPAVNEAAVADTAAEVTAAPTDTAETVAPSTAAATSATANDADTIKAADTTEAEAAQSEEAKAPAKPRTRRAPVRRKKAEDDAVKADAPSDEAEKAAPAKATPATRTRRTAASKTAASKTAAAKAAVAETAVDAAPAETAAAEEATPAPAAKPRTRRAPRRKAESAAPEATSTDSAGAEPAAAPSLNEAANDPAGISDETAVGENGRPTRRGWWQRTFGE